MTDDHAAGGASPQHEGASPQEQEPVEAAPMSASPAAAAVEEGEGAQQGAASPGDGQPADDAAAANGGQEAKAEAGEEGREGAAGADAPAPADSKGEEGSRERRRERSRSRSRRDSKPRERSRDRRRDERRRSRSKDKDRRRSRSRDKRSRRDHSRERRRSRSRDRRRDGSREKRRSGRSGSRSRRRRSSSPHRRGSRRYSRSRSRSPSVVPPLPTRPALAAGPPMVPAALPGLPGGLNPGLLANPYLMPNLAGGLQSAGLNQATRRARELYIGNLPQPCMSYQLQTFLNQALVALGLCTTPGKMPIIKCEVSPGGGFAFIEFAEIADCTCALALDGIPFMGTPLRVGRPKGYVPTMGAPPDPAPLGAAALAALLGQAENSAVAAVATGMPPGTDPATMAAAAAAAAGIALQQPAPGAGAGHAPALPMGVPAGPNPATRRARELYIGGLPQPCLGYQLQTFLNQTLVALGLCTTPGKMPIIKCEVSPGGAFAFIELQEMGDATMAVALDGIPYMGTPLRIGRPKGYVPPMGAPPDPAPLGTAALTVLLEQQSSNPMAGAAAATATGGPAPGGPPGH